MAKGAKINFKSCMEDQAAIIGDIRRGELSPIYLLLGEEPYSIDRISSVIASEILSAEEREFNLNILYGKDCSGREIVEMARAYPMMASYNIVIVRQAADCSDLEQVSSYAGSMDMMPRSTILVLCYSGKSMDKRSQLYKRIKDFGRVFESVRPREYEIAPWIHSLFKEKGRRIEDKAVAMMAEKLGTDLAKIDMESDKLLTALGSGSGVITPADIQEQIGISKDFNTFELTRALSERNGHRAIMIVNYFEKNRNDGNIYGAFSLLFNHFSRIFTLGMMLWDRGRKQQPPPSDSDIMKQLKLSSPIFVREYRTALGYYSAAKAFTALGLIRKYEMKVKGVEAGSASAAESLRELIIKILAL